MSTAALGEARIPWYDAIVDFVEITIEPEDLVAAGWAWVGKPGQESKHAPAYLHTEDHVDLQVAPTDLQDAGWTYTGEDAPTQATVFEQVHAWHDEEHDGPFRWCQHSLCDRVRGR